MKRALPPVLKIYEALGCIADGRIEIQKIDQGLFGDVSSIIKAKVISSSGGKYYEVEYDESKNAIMANDSASYWQGYLSYPSITLLLKLGKLSFNKEFANALKDIKRKDLNTQNKKDGDKGKTQQLVDELLTERGVDLDDFRVSIEDILNQIIYLDLNLLGSKKIPPKGY